MNSTVKLILRISFILVGTGLLIGGLITLYLGVENKNWPVAKGQIVYSEVRKVNLSGSSPEYKPIVQYSYKVDGQSYTNGNIAIISQTYGTREKAQQKIRPYSLSTFVDVYYHTTNPQKSLLETGIHSGSYFMIVIGMILIILNRLLKTRGSSKKIS